MKAVVMEKKQNEYVVLCDDGTFRKVTGNYVVGQEIKYSEAIDCNTSKKHIKSKTKNISKIKYLAGIAAAAVIFLGIGAYQVAFACSYVTLDVNPSIEYTLNRLNRVIAVNALNDDASDVVDSLSSSGITMSSLEDAINMTVNELQSRGYLVDDEGAVLIDIVSDNDSITQSLQDDVSNTAIFNSESASVVCLSSDTDARNIAADQGISTGRYEVMIETSGVTLNTEDSSSEDLIQDSNAAAEISESESESGSNSNSEKSNTRISNQLPSDGNMIDVYRKASVSDLINDLEENSVPTINNNDANSDNSLTDEIENNKDNSSDTIGPDSNADTDTEDNKENGIFSDENIDGLPDDNTKPGQNNEYYNNEKPSAPENGNNLNEDSAPQEELPGTEGNNTTSNSFPDANDFDQKGANGTGGPFK